MQKNTRIAEYNDVEKNMILINKIYESFEALEETLGQLKMEEPLFITYVAKKSFANMVFKDVKKEATKKELKN